MRRTIHLKLTDEQIDELMLMVFKWAKTDDDLWADICEAAQKSLLAERREGEDGM